MGRAERSKRARVERTKMARMDEEERGFGGGGPRLTDLAICLFCGTVMRGSGSYNVESGIRFLLSSVFVCVFFPWVNGACVRACGIWRFVRAWAWA